MATYTQQQYDEALSKFRLAERTMYEAKKAKKALDSWEPLAGMSFKVIRGRKFPIGTTARADAIGEKFYGPYVRFTLDGQIQFISLRNVEWPAYEAKRNVMYDVIDAAEEAVKAASSTIVEMAGIDLKKPLEKGTLTQREYTDSYTARYACNPDAPTEVLQAALEIMDPEQSSWGALRWSRGSSIISRDGGTVVITSNTGIAD